VYGRPASRVVADFMGLVNLLPATVVAAENGRARLSIVAGWTIEADIDAALRPGQAVEVAIRPESVRLQPAARAERPGLVGKVSESTFLGNMVDYHVALDGGIALRVQTHPLEQFAVGDSVAVLVDAAQCTVFEAI
jgi:ABC-type Fe3+/spermidine/putrescine transport system ATPase subunit